MRPGPRRRFPAAALNPAARPGDTRSGWGRTASSIGPSIKETAMLLALVVAGMVMVPVSLGIASLRARLTSDETAPYMGL
jgi:hypothetical protein